MKVLILFSLLLSSYLHANSSTTLCQALEGVQAIKAKAMNINDGDTLTAAIFLGGRYHNARIRLLGIDAPESFYQGKNQGFWAERSTNSLKSMIHYKQEILLEFEESFCDYYGRLIAKVLTKKFEVNKEQLRRGLAVTYCFNHVTALCVEYAKVMKEVIDNRREMYQDPNLVLPYIFRYQVNEKARSQSVMNLETREEVDFEEIHRIPPHLRVFIPWSQ